jgi:hypothetical protein
MRILKEFEDTEGGNQDPYIEEKQTTQWPKEKGQKDKQRSIKHTHKTDPLVTNRTIFSFWFHATNYPPGSYAY